jgi:oligopeptidase B
LNTILFFVCLLTGTTAAAAAGQDGETGPPVARTIARVDTLHGEVRVDPYFWLRDDRRAAPEVLSYLEAENRYTDAHMRHTDRLQQKLYQEMVGRIKETDLSVPEYVNGFWYYTRTVKDQQYPIFCRKRGTLKAPEEVLLDENAVAGKRPYSRVGVRQVSPDGNILAYTWDTTGGEWYTLMFKDLRNRRLLSDRIDSVNYEVEWAADNHTVFYGRTMPPTGRTGSTATSSAPQRRTPSCSKTWIRCSMWTSPRARTRSTCSSMRRASPRRTRAT